MDIIKPMLAKKITDLRKVILPVIIQPKIDGIRLMVKGDHIQTRSGKELPNVYIRDKIYKELGSLFADIAFDGELVTTDDIYQTTSDVMSDYKVCDFTFIIFDIVDYDLIQEERIKKLQDYSKYLPSFCTIITSTYVHTIEQLLKTVSDLCTIGEGAILRKPKRHYTQGKTEVTTKYKPTLDTEAYVIGFEEEMENCNEAFTNEMGRTSRASNKENLVGKGRVGVILATTETWGDIRIGSGLTHEQRQHIWDNQHLFIGKLVKFSYLPFGTKDKPRSPTFLTFRDERDL